MLHLLHVSRLAKLWLLQPGQIQSPPRRPLGAIIGANAPNWDAEAAWLPAGILHRLQWVLPAKLWFEQLGQTQSPSRKPLGAINGPRDPG